MPDRNSNLCHKRSSFESLLTQALTHPATLGTLVGRDWSFLIHEARRAGLLARIHDLLAKEQLLDAIPIQPRMHLDAARIIAENERRIVHWELDRLKRALDGTGVPIVLLKGAAYVALNLPNSRGRISSDVDILVPKEKIQVVESALLEHGWEHIKLDEYDQYYYRTWSHELPPLRHRERKTILDVHHTILPLTGRLQPNAGKLLEAALPVDGISFKVLAPPDMVLHSAAHAFQDGDLQRGLRDLVDLDDLLRHFGSEPAFWNNLVVRAKELDLWRPLYYGLRYSRLTLQTPIPDRVLTATRDWGPIWPAAWLMDKLVISVLGPSWPEGRDVRSSIAARLLYARSMWLRMPPWLLALHLAHKIVTNSKWPRKTSPK